MRLGEVEMRLKKRAEDRRALYVFSFLVLVAIFIFAFFFVLSLIPLKSQSFEVSFDVGEKIGVVANDSALIFGGVIPESVSTKRILVLNTYDFPVVLRMAVNDEIYPFLSVDSEVIVESGQDYSLPVILTIPRNASFGSYRGRIRINVFKS